MPIAGVFPILAASAFYFSCNADLHFDIYSHIISHMDSGERIRIVRAASVAALVGNIAICLTKLIAGIYLKSLSVLGDGIDSATDIAMSIMTLAVSFIISRPSDKKHAWGHQRAETVATLVLAFVILTAGLQLSLAALRKLYAFIQNNDSGSSPSLIAVAVTTFSIAGKLALALNQYILGKKAESPMIQANAKNMRNDVVLSTSVLTGLLFSHFLKLPVLDAVTAFSVSIWIIKSGITIFVELNVELMDGNTDELLYKNLFEAVKSVEGAYNPHKARIRKMANLLDIDIDVEVDADLSVYEAHIIAEKVTESIKNKIENVYDVMVHIEPKGFAGRDHEAFGLSEKDIL